MKEKTTRKEVNNSLSRGKFRIEEVNRREYWLSMSTINLLIISSWFFVRKPRESTCDKHC